MIPDAEKTRNREIIQEKGGVLAVWIFSAIINLLILALPIYMIQIYDRVLTSQSLDTLITITIITIIAFLFMAIFDAFRMRILKAIAGSFRESNLEMVIPSSATSTPVGYPNRPSLYQDITTVRTLISSGALVSVFDSPFSPFFLIIIFIFHPLLGWVAAFGMGVLFIFSLLGDLISRNSSERAFEHNQTASCLIDQVHSNFDIVVGHGMKPDLEKKLSKLNTDFGDNSLFENAKEVWIFSFAKAIRLCIQAAMLGFGAWLTIEKEISAGVIIAASVLMGRALAPIEQTITSWRYFVGGLHAYRRIKKNLHLTQVNEIEDIPVSEGLLTISDLSHTLGNDSDLRLEIKDLTVAPGTITGIVGPSGGGKTTLARLIIGALKPDKGFVQLDGLNITDLVSSVRSEHIGYLPQSMAVFPGTIRENISRFTEASLDEVLKATSMAGIHQTIIRLPEGYDTDLGSRNVILSGGELQKIALSTAIFRLPKLLVFDEPDSNLDASGEKQLKKTLLKLRSDGHTIILIGHRKSLMEIADTIHVIEGGEIRFSTTPQNLMKTRTPPAKPS